TLTGADAKKYLLGVERSGIYSVVDIKNVGVGGPVWGVFDGLQAGTDLFWDTLDSLYASHLYAAERGRIAIPVLPNKSFQVVGVVVVTDASPALPSNLKVTLFNVSNGKIDDNRADGLSVAGDAGNHIALFIEQQEVDPTSSLSIVFSKKIYTGASATDDDINT